MSLETDAHRAGGRKHRAAASEPVGAEMPKAVAEPGVYAASTRQAQKTEWPP
jgi:hypothetical protein